MLFWIIVVALTVLAAALLVLPLWRGTADADAAEVSARSKEIVLYRDQLAEVDRDLARGVLSADEADRTRTEIARRLLAADKEATTDTHAARPNRILAGIAGLLVIAVALGLYQWLGAPGYPDIAQADRIAAGDARRDSRPDQLTAEAAVPPATQADVDPDYLDMVNKLREIVPTQPDNPRGWQLLARQEDILGLYPAAARAQERYVTLLGDASTVEDRAYLLDLYVAATGGYVSPEAEGVIRQLLDMEPTNLAGRYYLGLLYANTDRPDYAFRLWRDLVEGGDPASPYVQLARGQVEEAAFYAGVNYSLPELPGPNADDVAAAAGMSADDQGAMIQGMVQRLSDRLATEGGTPDEWARLVNALGVLGETDRAAAIWTEAQQVFAGDDAALATIRAAAQAAGVAE